MDYNEAPYAYTSNSHVLYHDSPSLPNNDTCFTTPLLDSSEPTFGDLTHQLVHQFNELIDKWTEELMGLEYGGKAYLDLVEAINGLVKKHDLMISRTSLEREGEECETMRAEKEKEVENDEGNFRTKIDLYGVLEKGRELVGCDFWSSDGKEPCLELCHPTFEEGDVKYEENHASTVSLFASPLPIASTSHPFPTPLRSQDDLDCLESENSLEAMEDVPLSF